MIEELKKDFLEKLEAAHEYFDPAVNLVISDFGSPGYHTTLKSGKVHKTREGIGYALGLLDSGEEKYLERAEAIIRKIISLQDKEEKNKTYGIWSWFYEEPLSQMSPPDWNWADFIGKELVQILLFHKDRLQKCLIEEIKDSLHHAAYSIKRRDITPDYTNIHIMGSYVTLMAGQLLEDEVLSEYGRERMRAAVRNLEIKGGFSEYNSPTYTILAIQDISKMLRDFTGREAHENAEILNDAAWKMLGEHYHPSTGMLSAPHGRCYDDFMSETYFKTIKQGISDTEYDKNNLASYISFVKCPAEYLPLFQEGGMPRYIIDNFEKVQKVDFEPGSLSKSDFGRSSGNQAITYMTEEYSMGSFSKSDLWNQRRPLMCYFKNKDKVTNLKIRAIHNDYDYCSVLTTINQVENKLICALNFASDYGDTHVNLDMVKNSTIKAKNFKIRFQVSGQLEDVILPETLEPNKDTVLTFGGNKAYLNLVHYAFDETELEFVHGQDDQSKWIDIVLYEGEEKEIDFSRIERAVIVFTLGINERVDCSVSEEIEGGTLKALFENKELADKGIEVVTRPDSYVNIKSVNKVS